MHRPGHSDQHLIETTTVCAVRERLSKSSSSKPNQTRHSGLDPINDADESARFRAEDVNACLPHRFV